MHCFRINELKITEQALFGEKKSVSDLPWDQFSPIGVYYAKRVYRTGFPVGKLFEHSLGLLYVQSVSSMLPALVLDPKPGECVLDLCAAPGSKTTLLAERMKNSGFLVANEISGDRLKTLAANCDRMGLYNCALVQRDGGSLGDVPWFDKILLDPPCSALGSLQDPSKKRRRQNLERLEDLTALQYRLLGSSAKMLKEGGEMVYSTCTTTLEENEALLERFVRQFPFEIVDIVGGSAWEPNASGEKIFGPLENTLRIAFETLGSEAFFVAKLRKKGPIGLPSLPVSKSPGEEADRPAIRPILQFLSEAHGISPAFWTSFLFELSGENLYFFRKPGFALPSLPFARIGMKLAVHDPKNDWKLTTPSAQVLGKEITRNIVELEKKQDLISYYYGNSVKTAAPDFLQGTVRYRGWTIGTGKVRSGVLFSQFPKTSRMTQIDLGRIL